MGSSRPALEVAAFIPVSMDGLSVSFQVMEPTGSRQDLKFRLQTPGTPLPTSQLLPPLLTDRPEPEQRVPLQRVPREMSPDTETLNLKKNLDTVYEKHGF